MFSQCVIIPDDLFHFRGWKVLSLASVHRQKVSTCTWFNNRYFFYFDWWLKEIHNAYLTKWKYYLVGIFKHIFNICVYNTDCIYLGVEFGARMITIDGKQIKLQIWDTVSTYNICLNYVCCLIHRWKQKWCCCLALKIT